MAKENDPEFKLNLFEQTKLAAEKEIMKIYNENKGKIELVVLCPSLMIGSRLLEGETYQSEKLLVKIFNNNLS